MKRSERLNDMLFFLNDKSTFNLADIIKRYNISKSTALRDIKSLEQIGMPIYSHPGRNGYYSILQNKLLSPIVFNIDEVFALYFSMLTLRAYESTPFHLSVELLKRKFEKCLSKEKIETLQKTEKVFSLTITQQNNHCKFLDSILKFAIDEKVCEISYRKTTLESKYIIQFFNISSSYGQWYCTGYNFESEKVQVFRVDKILSVNENFTYTSKPLLDFIKSNAILYRNFGATDYEVKITKKGADIFAKEHYPSMKLSIKDNQYFIRGYYNQGEETFISNYFIAYGKEILSIEPIDLKELILKQLNNIHSYFSFI